MVQLQGYVTRHVPPVASPIQLAAETPFVADTKHTNHTTSNKPRFSAGLVTGIVTLAWIVIFAIVMVKGTGELHQHDAAVATQAN